MGIQPVIYESIVDVSSNNNFTQISVMEGDSESLRSVKITVISQNTPYVIPDDITVYLIGTKPDGKQVMYSCEHNSNIVTFSITPQMVAVPGKSIYQIMFIDNDGNNLKSFPFHIIVNEAFDIGDIKSSNEYEFLSEIINSATPENNPFVNATHTSAINAEASALQAQHSAESALNSANEAKASKQSASTSASNAQTSATQSANSATASATSASNAKISETNAKTSETNAKSSETKASSSESKAKTSETNAKASETKAKNSETNAATSEQNAKASEENAKTSETNAKLSEQNAQSSESNSSDSASSASESAISASASAENAQTSESKAKTSETNAKSSETKAKTSETNAKSSETKAATSASNAKTSETNAKTSETNSATSEANAKDSETKAATSESNAKSSETKAKTSETNAKSSETKAKTSETNAKTSETNASSSASSASTSASNAKTSETNSANSADLAHKWATFGSSSETPSSTNNAKYWSNQAKASKDSAATLLSQIQTEHTSAVTDIGNTLASSKTSLASETQKQINSAKSTLNSYLQSLDTTDKIYEDYYLFSMSYGGVYRENNQTLKNIIHFLSKSLLSQNASIDLTINHDRYMEEEINDEKIYRYETSERFYRYIGENIQPQISPLSSVDWFNPPSLSELVDFSKIFFVRPSNINDYDYIRLYCREPLSQDLSIRIFGFGSENLDNL